MVLSVSHSTSRRALAALWALAALAGALVPPRRELVRRVARAPERTRCGMVFDFFQKASDDFGSFLEQKAKDDALALAKFTAGLEKSRDQFGKDLKAIFGGAAGANLDDTVDALEDALLSADIGAATTTTILEDVRAVAEARGEYAEADVTAILRGRMAEQSLRRKAVKTAPYRQARHGPFTRSSSSGVAQGTM